MLRFFFVSLIVFATFSSGAQNYSRWVLEGYESLHTDSTIVNRKLSENLFSCVDTVNLKYGRIDSIGNIIIPLKYVQLDHTLTGPIRAMNESHFGYLDHQGKTVIPFEYEVAYPFRNGTAVVTKNLGNNFGTINEDNEVIISHKYFRLNTFDSNIFSFQLGEGQAGIMDAEENVIVKPEFDWVKKIGNGFWYGIKGKSMTVFNQDGSLHVKNKFEYVDEEYKFDLIEAKVGDKIGFWDFEFNNVIPPIYDKRPFGFYGHIGELMILKKGEHWGLIDSTGNAVVPFEFSKVTKAGRKHCILKRGEKFNVIDEFGNILLEEDKSTVKKIRDANFFFIDGNLHAKSMDIIFDSIQSVQTEFYQKEIGLLKVTKNDKVGYVDSVGNVTIPFIYEEGKNFHENGVTAVKKNGKWGFINADNKLLTDFTFDKVKHDGGPPKECQYEVVKEGSYGFFKLDKLVVPPEYEGFYLFQGENSLIFEEGNKYGIIDYAKDLKLEAKYDGIMPKFVCYNVEIDNKFGIVDLNLKEVIAPKYDEIKTYDVFSVVKLDSKYGTVSHTGNIIEPLIFDSFDGSWVSGRGAIRKVSQNGKFGIIGSDGALVVPTKYDDIKRLDYYDNVELILNGTKEIVNLGEIEFERNKN